MTNAEVITRWRMAASSLNVGDAREAAIIGSFLRLMERVSGTGQKFGQDIWLRLVRSEIQLAEMNPLLRQGIGIVTDLELDIWAGRIASAYKNLESAE